MGAPENSKDADSQDAAHPPQEPMRANPPPYDHYPTPPAPTPLPPPATILVQPTAMYHTGLGPTMVPSAVIISQNNVGPDPLRTTCRTCNQEMVTRIDRRPTMRNHFIAAMFCLVGCWPCIAIPYCVDSCLSTEHYCTHCGAFIGSYYRY